MDIAYVSSSFAGLLLKYIQQEKLNVPDIIAELLRASAAKRLEYRQWCALLDELVKATGNLNLGLSLGALADSSHYGVLGHLALSCETTGEALLHFERYQRLLYGGHHTQAVMQGLGTKSKFCWPVPPEDFAGSHYSDEALVSGLVHFVRGMTGRPDLSPEEVAFRNTKPATGSRQRGLDYDSLDCPVIFNQPNLHVIIGNQLLNLPLSTHDSTLRSLLDQQAKALLSVLPGNDELEQKIKRFLVKCMQEGQPTLETLARYLNTSPRTLHRKLESRGTNFKDLLLITRKELATQYLRDNTLTFTEIAMLLGYSEQSAFSRAFKQWTGKSPKKYVSD